MSYELIIIFVLAAWIGVNECRFAYLEKEVKNLKDKMSDLAEILKGIKKIKGEKMKEIKFRAWYKNTFMAEVLMADFGHNEFMLRDFNPRVGTGLIPSAKKAMLFLCNTPDERIKTALLFMKATS